MVIDSVESLNILLRGHHQAFVLRAPKWLAPALASCMVKNLQPEVLSGI